MKDDINDEVIFKFPNMRKAGQEVHIFIYDLYNNQVADITAPVADDWRWDGTDTDRQQLGQGTYIYLVKVGDEVECTGTISIAR
jgi:gliding motility-associated-like protein